MNDAARKNISTECAADLGELHQPFASGGFRLVAMGEYTKGERDGEKCVIKWFKDWTKQYVAESDMFSDDIKCIQKAIELVTKWNECEIIDQKIKVNECSVWTWKQRNSLFKKGDPCLVEPFIENFKKFNSNAGWSSEGEPWTNVMQALSHFSYHVTGGNLVLSDLQGGLCSNGMVLTDPVILSRTEGYYGNTDLGTNGILTFFDRHNCNDFCRKEWAKPRNPSSHFNMTMGTTMISSRQRRQT